MYHHRDSFGADYGSGIAGVVIMVWIFLLLLIAFLVVAAVAFVTRTFVKYPKSRKTLWIALAFCIATCIGSGLLYNFTRFGDSYVLVGIGIAVLLMTCLVVELKNRDTLMRENVNLIDQVLNAKSWWGSEDKPLEREDEQLAA